VGAPARSKRHASLAAVRLSSNCQLARRSAGSLVQRGYLDENRGKADPFYNGECRGAWAVCVCARDLQAS
jgi:hypothetical protein